MTPTPVEATPIVHPVNAGPVPPPTTVVVILLSPSSIATFVANPAPVFETVNVYTMVPPGT